MYAMKVREVVDLQLHASLTALLSVEESAVCRVSQGECARLRENVPYVKLHRSNPKKTYI